MAKDNSSQHVWRILMICLMFGLGALLLTVGYLAGVKLAGQQGMTVDPNGVVRPVENSNLPTPGSSSGAKSLSGSVYEEGISALNQVTVKWLPESGQSVITLPFTIPAKSGYAGETLSPSVNTGRLLGEATDGRGKVWDLVRVDIPWYEDFGGANDYMSVVGLFLKPKTAGSWELLNHNFIGAFTGLEYSNFLEWTPVSVTKAIENRLEPEGSEVSPDALSTWLKDNSVTMSDGQIGELSMADFVADQDRLNVSLKRHTSYFVDSGLLAQFKRLPVVAKMDDGQEIRMLFDDTVSSENQQGSTTPENEAIKRNTYYHVSDTGLVTKYNPGIPFFSEEASSADQLEISWLEGGNQLATYSSAVYGGCGIVANGIFRTLDQADLVQTGSIDGVAIYGARNPQANADYQAVYASWTAWKQSLAAYDGSSVDTSWTAFLGEKPLFYWQNFLGQWMLFISGNVVPVSECGKPVIYLYPQETTTLNLQLYLQGGFTASIPPYGENGWTVTAAPDGTLLNQADGQTYPYLFWEGFGGEYPQSGFYDVVARDDVPMYLINTLWTTGFNQTEMRDFMDFWLPRMQSAPYYKISWIGTEAFNQLAPLSISQKPDTMIRVLMEYEPLAVAEDSKPAPVAERPERTGFTLLEWGGVLKTSDLGTKKFE